MYKVSVPVMNSVITNYGPEKTLKYLKDLDAERVFLCPPSREELWNSYDSELKKMKQYVELFHNEGYEVGAWFWAFQYSKPSSYTYVVNPLGEESSTSVCPTDMAYRELMGGFVEDIAKCGVDLIQFDDDYRYGFLDNGFTCCCKNHLKMIGDILGEDVTPELMEEKLLHGGRNKYRDAFLKANGQALEDFSADMRKHLDKVNPDIRMGFCSCITSWDIDGTHPDRLSRLLAGNTKPFYRLIGAPYWAPRMNWGNRLADIIEFERSESERRKDKDIEIYSEGDTYPRPRFRTPAAYLEGFDTALRAAGCTDGILKYALDYASAADYETGYAKAHKRNRELYKNISALFDGKKSIGIRIWDKAEKYGNITIPKKKEGDMSIQDLAFSASSRLLTSCSLPSTYTETGYAGVAFGEDVNAVPDDMLSSGLILDVAACEILKARGIDTGLVRAGEESDVGMEVFCKNGNRTALNWGVTCKETEISSNAVVESHFEGNGKKYNGSYRYENALGQRFLVICADAYFNGEDLFRQYTRADQIIDAVPWLCGKAVPAVCPGNPDLYIQVKEGNGKTSVGLWNFCEDFIEAPEVTLSFTPKQIKAVNCTAEISGNRVILSDIQAFACAFFEAE